MRESSGGGLSPAHACVSVTGVTEVKHSSWLHTAEEIHTRANLRLENRFLFPLRDISGSIVFLFGNKVCIKQNQTRWFFVSKME